MYSTAAADHSGRRSKEWNVIFRANTGIVGSNPTWGMDVCPRFFCVCVVCRQQPCDTPDHPSKNSNLLSKIYTSRLITVRKRPEAVEIHWAVRRRGSHIF
jgi:hypothetical protein